MSLELIALLIFFATIAERFVELSVSRKNATWSFSRGGVEFGADHYKWMVIMHSFFLVSILFEYVYIGSQVSSELRVVAMVFAVTCQICRWWVIRILGSQWNTRIIVVPGMERVRRGPYRFMNHPNYAIVAVETLSLPLIFGAWRTALVFSLLNAVMMKVRIDVENRALRELR